MSTVMTVAGPVPSEELGVVLPHEHLFANVMKEYRGNGLLHDVQLAVEELKDFAAHGGGTLVELTPVEIGRDPEKLLEASRASGVHVVMGCGHYREPYLDRERFHRIGADALAEEMIREIEDGAGDTGVRPGIIGEIGNNDDGISPAEELSFRAAARAHLATGLTITTHAAWFPVGLAQLDLLEEEGVAPDRVIIGHADGVPGPAYQLELAARGAYVEFDGFGTDTAYDCERALDYIMALREHGHLDQVLVSHDIFLRTHMRARGGPGYTWIIRELLPRLRERGLPEDEISLLLVENPRAALTGSRAG